MELEEKVETSYTKMQKAGLFTMFVGSYFAGLTHGSMDALEINNENIEAVLTYGPTFLSAGIFAIDGAQRYSNSQEMIKRHGKAKTIMYGAIAEVIPSSIIAGGVTFFSYGLGYISGTFFR